MPLRGHFTARDPTTRKSEFLLSDDDPRFTGSHIELTGDDAPKLDTDASGTASFESRPDPEKYPPGEENMSGIGDPPYRVIFILQDLNGKRITGVEFECVIFDESSACFR